MEPAPSLAKSEDSCPYKNWSRCRRINIIQLRHVIVAQIILCRLYLHGDGVHIFEDNIAGVLVVEYSGDGLGETDSGTIRKINIREEQDINCTGYPANLKTGFPAILCHYDIKLSAEKCLWTLFTTFLFVLQSNALKIRVPVAFTSPSCIFQYFAGNPAFLLAGYPVAKSSPDSGYKKVDYSYFPYKNYNALKISIP